MTHKSVLALLLSTAFVLGGAGFFFNGTEMLDDPSLDPTIPFTLASGSDVLVAGVGLMMGQPGNISLAVPAGVSVQQVLAYWEGFAATVGEQGATDTITINGMAVTGDRIGGPTTWPVAVPPLITSTYRADITALSNANGWVQAGMTNVVSVGGLNFVTANDGAGLMVIVDDGVNTANLQLRDGNDSAFINFPPPLDGTAPVSYSFAASMDPRGATLSIFATSVGPLRPNVIRIWIDGVLSEALADVLVSSSGTEWDTFVHPFTVPAGATSVTVQLFSEDLNATGLLPASMVWIASALAITDTPGGGEGCTPGFWKTHEELWDGIGMDDVTVNIHTTDLFNATFMVTQAESAIPNMVNLLAATRLKWGGNNQGGLGSGDLYALNRHAAAALANADSSINFPYSVADVINLYRDAVGADPGPATIGSAKAMLEMANEAGCPF